MSSFKNSFVAPTGYVDISPQLSVANTNTDGVTGTYATLKTVAAGNFSTVDSVDIAAPGVVTNGKIRFYATDGTVTRYIDEVLVPATTPSATVAAFKTTWVPASGPYPLPSGWSMKASTLNGETFNLTVKGRDI